jgi:hypothetical protein
MAAKPISSTFDSTGNVIVTYDDNTKKTFLAPFAQAQKLLPQDLNPKTSTAPGVRQDAAGSYGSSGSGAFTTGSSYQPVVDTATGVQADTSGTIPFIDPKTKKAGVTTIGQQIAAARIPDQYKTIKNALIASNLIGKNTKSQTAVQAAWLQVLIGSQTAQMDPFKYMQSMNPGADTTTTGPQTNISLKTYSPNQIQSVAEQVYLNTVGRKPSAKELADLSNQLNVKEKSTPTKTVSTPNAAGNVTTSATSGGIDESAFIKSQVESNVALQPEVTRMKDINFSSWLMKAMSSGPEAAGTLANG